MWASLSRICRADPQGDMLGILKDPRSRFSLLLPPISAMSDFRVCRQLRSERRALCFARPGSRHRASRDLVARLDGTHVFHQVAYLTRASDIKSVIDDSRRRLLAIQIGPDFERNLLLGKPANIQLIADGRNSNTAGVALGYLGIIVDGFNSDWRSLHGLPRIRRCRSTARAWYNPL